MKVGNVFMIAALKFTELLLLLTAAIMMTIETVQFIKLSSDWETTRDSVC